MAMLFEGFGDSFWVSGTSLKLAGFKVTCPYELESTVASRLHIIPWDRVSLYDLVPIAKYYSELTCPLQSPSYIITHEGISTQAATSQAPRAQASEYIFPFLSRIS